MNIRREAEGAARQKNAKSSKRRGGSDNGSVRDSEEPSAPGRGTKRARDNDIEKVRGVVSLFVMRANRTEY